MSEDVEDDVRARRASFALDLDTSSSLYVSPCSSAIQGSSALNISLPDQSDHRTVGEEASMLAPVMPMADAVAWHPRS